MSDSDMTMDSMLTRFLFVCTPPTTFSIAKPFVDPAIFDDRTCQQKFQNQGDTIQSAFESSAAAQVNNLQSNISQLIHLLINFR